MTLQAFFLLLLVLIVSSVSLLSIRRKRMTRRLPPGPKRLPIIGNLHLLLSNFNHRSLQVLSYQYGPLMFLQLGSVPAIVISSADIAREIFKAHDLIFSSRPVFYTGKNISYNCASITMAPYGEYWREIRKIVLTKLLSPNRIQSFRAVIEEEIGFMIKFIESSSSPVNLSEVTHSLANNIVCRVAFGRKYERFGDGGSSKFLDLLREVQDLAGELTLSDFFPMMEWLNRINGLDARLQKHFGELDKVFDEMIEEHLDPKRPNTDHGDLVDVLLRCHNDPSQAIALKTHQIKAVISDVFIAGTDTSATTLEWTMTELMRNPLVMRRAQEEVRRVVKGKKTKVEQNELSQLVYLKSTLKESFRVHPPAPSLVPRETTESCRVGEYEIPAKARVFVNAAAIAMDPKIWENSNEFKPERFLDSSIDFRGQHFEFIPFGTGRRICPGINFAVQIIELALANLLYHFDWALPNGKTKEGLDMEEAQGITVHRKTPLYLVPTIATL